MAIKTAPILTREDYNAAQVTLGLTYAEVGKETGIPRQYLSEFRGGTRNLLPEHQRKLRSYFEDRGIVFEDYEDTQDTQDLPETLARTSAANMPEGVRSAAISYLHFAIDEAMQPSDLRKIAREMEDNEAKLEELMGKEAKEAGLFESGDWSAETVADMQEAFGLMAANFVLFSVAQGKSFVYRDTAEGEDAKTVRDVMNDTFASAFTGVVGGMVNAHPAKKQGQTANDKTGEEAWL